MLSRHIPALPLVCSLGLNAIDVEGASALAAVLTTLRTQITTLGCAAAPECSRLCQRPLTLLTTSATHSSARSLRNNSLGPKGAAALAEGLKGNSTLQSLG